MPLSDTFITIDRKILNWEWYSDPNMFHLFIHLILKANFKNANWRGVNIKRGQLITGRLKLATDTGLSERQVRTCLSKLKSTNEITIKTTSHYSIITICKYDTYQGKKKNTDQQSDQHNDQQSTSDRPTSDQRATTNKERLIRSNKEKEEVLGENDFIFKLQRIYETDWPEYESSLTNFQKKEIDEHGFFLWKKFVDFIKENKFEKLFVADFVKPTDFPKLYKFEKFTEETWEAVCKGILASGILPQHDLYFRIPQFLNYSKKEHNGAKSNNGSDTKLGTSTARTSEFGKWVKPPGKST